MTRAREGYKKKRKKDLKKSKGFRGSKHRLIKTAREQVRRAERSSVEGRKQRKRDRRAL